MNCINHFSNVLNEVKNISSNLLTPTAASDLTDKIHQFDELVERSQYVKVPLVGVFSAGKSSLLNIFTERPEVLPVDTMPETAVAYELYYDTNERVELYRNEHKIQEVSLSDIKSLETTPGDIAKVYMVSQRIKELQNRGIILVDMPGIGSGIDRHDAAIMNYINFGTSFILLVDADQGSLRGSTLVFLEELKKYNLKAAVLVSKTDKKPEGEVKEIIDYVAYQMSKIVDGTPYVSKVCAVNKDLDGFTAYLNGLDPEALLKVKVGKSLKGIIDMTIADMKMQKELKGKSVGEVEEKLKKLEEDFYNVKMELPTKNNQADTPEKSCQDILDNVRLALSQKSEEIATMIMNGSDKESVKELFISIIRSELVVSFKEEVEQYSAALGTSVNAALDDMVGITVDEYDFTTQYDSLISLAGEIVKMLGGVWSQIFGMMLPFITPLLKSIFGESDEEQLAQIKEKLQNVCFDKVINDLRPNVLGLIKENQRRIDEQLKQQVVIAFNKMRDGLQEQIENAKANKQEIKEQISTLDSAIIKLHEISTTI